MNITRQLSSFRHRRFRRLKKEKCTIRMPGESRQATSSRLELARATSKEGISFVKIPEFEVKYPIKSKVSFNSSLTMH